jgi:LemA protein
MPVLIGIGVVLLLAIIYWIVTYNRLIGLHQLIDNAWSNIDTELKRRYDLIPNLVETVKGYAAHEQETLERVVQARQQAVASTGSPQHQAADENELVKALRGVFVLAEGYPQLKANEHFLELQRELVNTENRIQAARRFYNGNVKDLNTLIAQFPSSIIARQGRFEPAEFFEVDSVFEREPVKVNLEG